MGVCILPFRTVKDSAPPRVELNSCFATLISHQELLSQRHVSAVCLWTLLSVYRKKLFLFLLQLLSDVLGPPDFTSSGICESFCTSGQKVQRNSQKFQFYLNPELKVLLRVPSEYLPAKKLSLWLEMQLSWQSACVVHKALDFIFNTTTTRPVWLMPVMPVLRKQKQKDRKFKVVFGGWSRTYEALLQEKTNKKPHKPDLRAQNVASQ